MPPIEHPDNTGEGKCNMLKCKLGNVATVQFICGNDECEKKVHTECYRKIVLATGDGKPPLAPLPEDAVVCTKKCYKAFVKSSNPNQKYKWNDDMKPETPNVTSERVLINYMTDGDNYKNYRGKDANGLPKKYHCQIIASKCTNLTLSERDHAGVFSKWTAMEDCWRTTNDWVNNTGVGVLADKGHDTFEACVLKRCPFYRDIEEIMIDRAGSNPAVTNNDLFNSDEDDEDDEAEAEATNVDNDADNDSDEKDDDLDASAAPTVAAKKTTNKDKKPNPKRATLRTPSPAPSVEFVTKETKDLFAEAKSSAAERLQLMSEQHAARMELEQRKVTLQEQQAAGAGWSAKTAEADCMFGIYEKCEKMSSNGMTDDAILMLLPDAQMVIDAKAAKATRTSPRKRSSPSK